MLLTNARLRILILLEGIPVDILTGAQEEPGLVKDVLQELTR